MRFSAIRPGDVFTSANQKDAFFHISIVERHRRLLRFSLQGVSYEFCVLPLGLSGTFAVCVNAILAPVRAMARRLVYLDDALIVAESNDMVSAHAELVGNHLQALGFLFNWKKSTLVPQQSTAFLGLELDSLPMRARLSETRLENPLKAVEPRRQSRTISLHQCSVILGLMTAAMVAVPPGAALHGPLSGMVPQAPRPGKAPVPHPHSSPSSSSGRSPPASSGQMGGPQLAFGGYPPSP